jgi:predicted tellurium resistance membrane protein TerC
LQYGLAAILGFVGLKMIVEEAFHDFHIIGELGDIYLSLVIIIGILAGSVILSMILPGGDEEEEAQTAAAVSESDE